MPEYKKPALVIDEQIQLLKERGIKINSEEDLANWLKNVSYFRCKNYFKNFRDTTTRRFISLTSFEDVKNLYLFDKKLRLLIFDALEIVETSLKTIVSNTMSTELGVGWLSNKDCFVEKFDHDSLMVDINKDYSNPLPDFETSISAHRKAYNGQELPPSWMIMEMITMGNISKIFESLGIRKCIDTICNHYQLPVNILISWFRCFTNLRNRCAHHSRIIYRNINMCPILPSRQKHKFLIEAEYIDNNTLYCALCCIQKILINIKIDSNFKKELKLLFDNNPSINLEKNGFTENWITEEIWK